MSRRQWYDDGRPVVVQPSILDHEATVEIEDRSVAVRFPVQPPLRRVFSGEIVRLQAKEGVIEVAFHDEGGIAVRAPSGHRIAFTSDSSNTLRVFLPDDPRADDEVVS